jgi:tRNA pseudouridine55 synthase
MRRGGNRGGRAVTGILLFDKPAGMSSNHALQRLKRLYRARKAGHTGSLDVPASGLLPICFGEATKVSGFLLDATKHYRAIFRLGQRTSTGDALGEVIETRQVPPLTRAQADAAVRAFIGDIEQVPPMHSAVKQDGKPLYELAYQGKTVQRRPRKVTIHALNLLKFDRDLLDLEIRCSKGTYVRALAEDLGERLGCGGHVAELRRLGVGPFDVQDAVGFEDLEGSATAGFERLDALLRHPDAALGDNPPVVLSEDATYYLCKGQPVLAPKAPSSGLVRLYDPRRRFLGIGEVLDDGRVAPRRLLKL